jgi:uncharacterized protein (DUF697 family)
MRIGAGSLPWRRPALLLAGTVVVTEGLGHWLHLGGGSLLGLGALAGGWLLLSRRQAITPRLPVDPEGWSARCRSLLPQFTALMGEGDPIPSQRRQQLDGLLLALEQPQLSAGLVSRTPPPLEQQGPVLEALRSRRPLLLHWGEPLPASQQGWTWPEAFQQADLLLYHLRWPLSAADLRWLEALPGSLPLWLLVEGVSDDPSETWKQELACQWPAADRQRALAWDGQATTLPSVLSPLSDWLRQQGETLRRGTTVRVLELLHRSWQAELEGHRRRRLQSLLQRTQWTVAAGVIAAPLPSMDLLVLAIANGLMLQEMARLWDCPWDQDTLKAAAAELARAALGLGLVEWSSQALLSASRLHGATWLVGGALQALSAAYLTRVVGRAMADVLALSSGVAEADLEALRQQAPMLVSRAAELERIDWSGFLNQARQWLQQRQMTSAGA